MAVVTMKQLLGAGVHFGHQTRRWNPKMRRFILGERNGIYLIDLRQTMKGIEESYGYIRDLVAGGGTILFVGTKKQTQGPVAIYADACGMPYVNERWLGGMLTNFQTVSTRVKRMKEFEAMQKAGDFDAMPKKEALRHTRELEKLQRNLGGIRGLDRLPDAIFVIDTKKEHIAVTEANKLGPAGGGGGRHQLRSRRDHPRDPGQRRRHPLRRPAVPGGGRRRGRGPVHRPAAAGPAAAAAGPGPGAAAAPAAPAAADAPAPAEAATTAGRAGGRARPRPPAAAEPPVAADRRADGSGPETAPEAAAPARCRRPPPRPPAPSRRPRTAAAEPRRDASEPQPSRDRADRPDRGGLTVPDFSAKDVQKLRQITGVGMLDAKKALEETDGDIDKAVTLLREKGLASQAKRADRDASEGAVAIGRAAARSPRSSSCGRRPTSWPSPTSSWPWPPSLADLVAAKGEAAIDERGRRDRQPEDHPQGEHLGGPGGPHRGPGRRGGRLLPAPPGRPRRQRRGRGPRRAGPRSWPTTSPPTSPSPGPPTSQRDDVPEDEVAAERETVEKIARNEGKPDAALPKIVEGRLDGWYKERVLLDQPYVKDEKQTIAKLLGPAKVTRFAQVVVGD